MSISPKETMNKSVEKLIDLINNHHPLIINQCNIKFENYKDNNINTPNAKR